MAIKKSAPMLNITVILEIFQMGHTTPMLWFVRVTKFNTLDNLACLFLSMTTIISSETPS